MKRKEYDGMESDSKSKRRKAEEEKDNFYTTTEKLLPEPKKKIAADQVIADTWNNRLAKESPSKMAKLGAKAEIKTYVSRSMMQHSRPLCWHILAFEEAVYNRAFLLIYYFRNPDITVPLRLRKVLRADRVTPMTLSAFRFGPILGSGSYGTVYRVVEKATGRQMALKLLTITEGTAYPLTLTSMLVERDALLRSNHPLVVRLQHAFADPGSKTVCFAFDYCDGGNFDSVISKLHGIEFHSIPENKAHMNDLLTRRIQPITKQRDKFEIARFYTAEIVAAVAFIHSRGIIHVDIKGDNIFLTANGHIKLGDLGLSVRFHWTHSHRRTLPYIFFPHFSDNIGGARHFLEADLVQFVVHNQENSIMENMGFASDWYSVGVLIYYLFAGFRFNDLRIHQDNSEFLQKVGHQQHTQFLADVIRRPEIADLLVTRKALNKIFGHNFLTGQLSQLLTKLLVKRRNRWEGFCDSYDVYRMGRMIRDRLVDLNRVNRLSMFAPYDLSQMHTYPAPFIPEMESDSPAQFTSPIPEEIMDFQVKDDILVPCVLPDLKFHRPHDLSD